MLGKSLDLPYQDATFLFRTSVERPFNATTRISYSLFRRSADRPQAERSEATIHEGKKPRFLERYRTLRGLSDRHYLFHSSYYRFSRDPNALNIVTVQDFIYEKYRRGVSKAVHHHQKSAAIRNARGVICVSKSTEADFRLFYPAYKGLLETIYLGVSPSFYPLPESPKKHLVLFVGSRAEYKNFDLLVKAFRSLKTFDLLIVGGGALSKEEVTLCQREIRGRYSLLGRVSDEELNKLYNSVFCFVYPSRYEGFGLPILEAMKAGCPVILGKTSAMMEIGGKAGCYFEEFDPDCVAEAIHSLQDESRRTSTSSLKFTIH